MEVWDVFGKRTADNDFVLVGGVTGPDDVEMALLLTREVFFRHKEGVAFAVRKRGDAELHVSGEDPKVIGGVTDRAYRRQEAYAGVGAKLKRVSAEMHQRGLSIDRPRPPSRGRSVQPT